MDSQTSRKRTYWQEKLDSIEPSSRLDQVVSYGPEDPILALSNNYEALVTEVITSNYLVKKMYIDATSSVDVLYYKTFQRMGLKDK